MDRVRNEKVCRRAVIESELASREDRSIEIVWTRGENVEDHFMVLHIYRKCGGPQHKGVDDGRK